MTKVFDLNLLRTLEALLATGSVTGAAERLHLSVPAVSHALARLREVTGDPIFVRAGRSLVPTPRALALKEPVGRWLEEVMGLAARPVNTDLRNVQRAFVLRAPDGMSVSFGAGMITALRETMPGSTLHFLPEAHADIGALREGRIDLDIGTFRARDPEIETVVLSRQTQVGAVRSDHALATGRRTARRYASQAHVMVTQRMREDSPVDDALAALGLQRTVVMTVPSAYGALVVASRSMLVATVSDRVARMMGPSLGLEVFDLPFEIAPESLVMAWHPRLSADPAHTWLRNLVQRVLSDAYWVPPALGTNTLRPLATAAGKVNDASARSSPREARPPRT